MAGELAQTFHSRHAFRRVIMKSRKNKNKHIRCSVCDRYMRADNMKRHAQTHKDIKREEQRQQMVKIAQQENIPIEHCNDMVQSTRSILDVETLEEELLQDNQDYLEKIELGKQIAAIIDKGTVREESLKRNRKEALDMHRKQKPRIDIQSVQLRIWQQELMGIITTPSDRDVFWICGFSGNEGKSWFQSYLKTFYGYAQVVRLDLQIKTANILHTLSKRLLHKQPISLFSMIPERLTT